MAIRYISSIECERFRLIAEPPLEYTIRFEFGNFFAECDDFEIYGAGISEEEAFRDLELSLVALWDSYAECDGGGLKISSEETKKRLLERFRKENK